MTRIYYCKTVRQLLCAIVHSIYNHSYKNILFISKWLNSLFDDLLAKLNKYGFTKIVLYSTWEITPYNNNDPKKFVDDIIKYYDKLMDDNDISLDEIDDYCLFASLRFSIYLSEKRKKFNLFEDANGDSIKAGFVRWNPNTDKVEKAKLAQNYHLLDGSSKYIKNLFANTKFYKNNIPDKCVHFDLDALLQTMHSDDINNLNRIFGTNSLNLCEVKVIVLTQNNLKVSCPYEIFWGLIMDTMVPCNSLLKPHPADKFEYSLMHDVLINRTIPSELLNISYSGNYCGISSSSLNTLKNKEYILGDEYLHFNNLFVYLSLVCLINCGFKNIQYVGPHMHYFELMCSKLNYIKNYRYAKVTIIEDEQCHICSENTFGKKITYHYDVEGTNYSNRIVVYSDIKLFSPFVYHHTLKYSGLNITISDYSATMAKNEYFEKIDKNISSLNYVELKNTIASCIDNYPFCNLNVFFKKMYYSGNDELKLLSSLLVNNVDITDPNTVMILGELYKKGIGVKTNLPMAINYYRMAQNYDIWMKRELAKCILEHPNLSTSNEFNNLINNLLSIDYAPAYLLKAKQYFYGIFEKKNLDIAEKYAKISESKKVSGSTNLLKEIKNSKID